MPEQDLILRMRVVDGAVAAADVDHVGGAIDRTERKARRLSETTATVGRGFGGLRTIIRSVTGIVGLGGLGLGIGEMIKNAQRFQDQAAQLGAAIKANIRNPTAEMQKQLLEFADTFTGKGGFAPPDEIRSMTLLLRVSHDVAKTIRDETLATNIARGAHLGLAQATRVVAMAEVGRTMGLTRLGIALPKHVSAAKAMAILLQRYGGATAAYNKTAAGSMSNFEHAIDVLGEKAGMVLTPALTATFTWLVKVLDQAQKGQGVFGPLGVGVHYLGTVLKMVVGDGKDVVAWLTRMIALFRDGDPRVRAVAIGIGSVAAGFVILRAALTAYSIAQWAANAAMEAFPLVLIITTLAAVATGLVYAYEKVKWFRDGVNGLRDDFSAVFGALPGIAAGGWKAVVGIVQGGLNGIIDAINAVIGVINGLPHISVGGVDIGFPHIGKIGHVDFSGNKMPTVRDMAPAVSPGALRRARGTITPRGADMAPVGRGATITPRGANMAPTTITPKGADMAPTAYADAVAGALHGASVVMDGQKVGSLMLRQGNLKRARQ